jgi:hypothetical protein
MPCRRMVRVKPNEDDFGCCNKNNIRIRSKRGNLWIKDGIAAN